MSSDFRQGLIVGALLTALAAMAFVGFCKAQDWLVLSGLAYHLEGHQCNSVTTGLGFERADASVGFYRKSNCKWSAYVAKAWLPLAVAGWRAGITAGGVTGYSRRITPVAALAATYETKRWGLNLIGIPPTGESSGGVIWLQYKVRF